MTEVLLNIRDAWRVLSTELYSVHTKLCKHLGNVFVLVYVSSGTVLFLNNIFNSYGQGPVVQSIVSLTSSLRGQLLKCFTTS